MAEKYLPLYRKYRPQEFGDLVGQENLVKAFTNAINTNKIAHAYLFCGPRGTGKTSSARILAKSLNCQNGPTLTPCGKCPSCLDILNGNMLDVIEMDAASNRSVEDAQNIIDKIHYAPVNGKYKIFIIDEVHMISKTAFNALLKTLEEPPENVIFILATTEPQKVLETIISRCQRFDFKRITVDDIVKRLKEISDKENINISDDALFAIAKNSQGGMRDALALLDQISVLGANAKITADNVYDMLGKIDNGTLLEITKYIFEKSVDKTIQKINEIYAKGNEPLQIIENLIQYLRNLAVIKTCSNDSTIKDLTLLSDDIISSIKTLVKNVTIAEISNFIERLTYYHKEIKYTNNRYLWLELCFIDIASESYQSKSNIEQISSPSINTKEHEQLKQPVNIKPTLIDNSSFQTSTEQENEIIKELEQPQAQTQLKTETEKQNFPQQHKSTPVNGYESKPKVTVNSGDSWKTLLGLIDSPPSRSFFNTFAKPVELSENKVIITFKNETFGKRAKEPQKLDAIKKACMKYFNVTSIEIEIRIGEAPSTPKISQAKENTQLKSDNKAQTNNSDTPTPQVPKQQKKEISTGSIKTEYPSENEDSEPDFSNANLTYNSNYSDQVKMVIDLFDAKVFD